ncbi:hypothetical protein QAD02_020794 [Eretmocerus hayati]|uniref:Uncharacterized protein n=1 Tax=Eretmocerus hayati TaxID=131215 RepID=A0ACC2PQC0_9HYME|nr:hypothetical protein QAD02_020794 [Eretmocerus hayati]
MSEKLDAIQEGFDKQFDSLKCNIESLNKSFSKDITNLKSELKSIKESCATIDSLSVKIDSAQEDIENLKLSVDHIPKLHQDIANIRAEVSKSLSSQVMSSTSATNMEELIHEAQERMLRSRNLLFFNVPESNNQSADYGMIINLLKEIPVDTRNLVVSRIGNPSSNHIRPIAVTFSNNQDPHLVMRNRRKIPGRIIVGFDKTKNQQAQYKEAAARLKARLDSGESGLSIRYIKGVPNIVKSDAAPSFNQLQNSQRASGNF